MWSVLSRRERGSAMTAGKFERYGTLTIILLSVIIVIGGVAVWSRYRPAQPVEITLTPLPLLQGRIYLGGAVTNPGLYSLKSGDSIGSLLQAAGGATDSANLSGLKLHVPAVGEEAGPQKVDINRAEVWLLEALPGIGETLAQRIVDYRQQNGPFLNIAGITRVEGIGTTTYERIKDLITVIDE